MIILFKNSKVKKIWTKNVLNCDKKPSKVPLMSLPNTDKMLENEVKSDNRLKER